MAGIYFHIPFCRQACHYCNFHFSTSLRNRKELLAALHQELEMQRDYLGGANIETVYFGGGTPSLLEAEEIAALFERLQKHYNLSPDAEITLEANPDDLTLEKLQALRQYTPVNRLSIGVQSFFEEDLLWMNRAHNSSQSRQCIENALNTGFSTLTLDLIYGSPTLPDAHWLANLQTVFDYKIPHLSCYALTVEPKTALADFVKKGKTAAPSDEHTARQFEILLAKAKENGYEQYEISNFCIPPHYAKHNSNYWRGVPYLGLGPSAHSFDGDNRQWNISNNQKYIKAMNEGQIPFEKEVLTLENRYNEYLMTGLRTRWGIDAQKLEQWDLRPYFERAAAPYLASAHLEQEDSFYRFTDAGKLLSDAILADLFV